MIKRENLKHAIDAIARREPQIGYALDRLLGTGQIDVPSGSDAQIENAGPCFLFEDQTLHINKFSYFHEGTAPLEQGLLIKYGELIEKQALLSKGDGTVDFRKAARQVRDAGLKFMVTYEINRAIDRLENDGRARKNHRESSSQEGSLDFSSDRVTFLENIKSNHQSLSQPPRSMASDVLYQGIVGTDTSAVLMHFPYNMETLMQVADINLEFFSVRFVLNCLVENRDKHLFACIVNQKIVGLLFLDFKRALFYRGLEIKYIATLGGLAPGTIPVGYPLIRGIGTFIIAGVWLLWKSELGDYNEVFLSSEIISGRFYENIGFYPRRSFEYVLKEPSGQLLKSILMTANHCPRLEANVPKEIARLIQKQTKALQKPARKEKDKKERILRLSIIEDCLHPRTHPVIARAVLEMLHKYRNKIPESEKLIKLWAQHHGGIGKPVMGMATRTVGVVWDSRFAGHLEQIFHLESAKRIEAVHSILYHPTLENRYYTVQPRAATAEELRWAHTAEHIDRIAQTAGKQLSSLDMDTQTSEKSYEVARLAVGGIFNLIDEIINGKCKRGFAFIRPPGHHAEPDKAMGFCLFNNIALGAEYLIRKHAVNRIMIIDIDTHHGNGTQAAFYDSRSVLYISLHQFPDYPGTGNLGEVGEGEGEGFTINVPLSKGLGDREYAQTLYCLLSPLAKAYLPEILLVSCGFDLYIHDRLGKMRITPEGYALVTRLLLDIADQYSDGRIAFIMEGGYSLKGIRECGLRVMQVLCGISTPDNGKLHRAKSTNILQVSHLRKVIQIHKKYWPILQ